MSVIIPAYNAEDTIVRCLGSIPRHNTTDVIVVDDGSDDGTRRILENLSASGEVFRTLRLQHKGTAAARNAGLRQARGEYVCFLDADDELGKDTGLIRDLPYREDIVIFRSFDGLEEKYPWHRYFLEGVMYRRKEVIDRGYLRGSVCGCIFKRSFLLRGGISFPESVRYGEDSVFFAKALSLADDISFHDMELYRIHGAEGSVSRSFAPADMKEYRATLEAMEDIPDAAARSCAMGKTAITLVSKGLSAGMSEDAILHESGLLDKIPIPLAGRYGGRWKIALLNRFPRLFCRLIKLRDA